MRQKNIIQNLVILAAIITNLIAGMVEAKAMDLNTQNNAKASTGSISCRRARSYEERIICREIETQILAATVRIEMHGYHLVGGQRLELVKGGKSHATVVGGRYLVTHNHYKYDLTREATADGAGYTAYSLRRADGTLVLDHAALSSYTIVHQKGEILVLDLGTQNGVGRLERLGLASAQAIAWQAVNWTAGMEIAHIDWNEQRAHVDWVQVEEVATGEAVAHLQVGNYATKGASGGGAYWNGQHIGNVWARNLEKDANGAVTRLYTLIALNTADIDRLDD